MRVLRKYFNGTDTIIGLGHIQNGCQFFNIENADAVFDEYRVPKKMQDEVMQLLAEEMEREKTIDFSEHIKIFDNTFKEFILQVGIKEHLDILVGDENREIRCEVAKYGHKEHLDILVNDIDSYVRYEVAKHGHKEHLDLLVDDESLDVRYEVATHNHKELLDILVNDNYDSVRWVVAKHHYKDLLEVLVDDENWFVERQAKETLKEMEYF